MHDQACTVQIPAIGKNAVGLSARRQITSCVRTPILGRWNVCLNASMIDENACISINEVTIR
jgi:hypothetical protein